MSLKRHRILYVELPGVVGGTVTGLYELVRHLDTSRYEPMVLFHKANHPYRQPFDDIGVKVLSLGEQIQPPRTPKSAIAKFQHRVERASWAASVVARTASLIKREKIDLVHHNDNLPKDRYTVMAAKLANVRQICHIRTLKGLSSFDRRLAGGVDQFIYMSKAIETVYREAGIPAAQGKVVYDGFNSTVYEQFDPNDVAALRAEFGVSDDDWLISNVGRLDNWKGQDYFLEAIAEVVKSHPNLKALLVGAPESTPWNQAYYQKLKQLVVDLDLANHVVFTGYRSDIPRILAASDIMVHSASLPEPFGRVVVEGMLAGCPVIATAAGGVLDSVDDHETGLLVPPKDAIGMAKAIMWLLQDRERSKLMGQRARQRAEQRFSVSQHIAAVEAIYETLLVV
ncbi:glycosyltransferase [Oculatella sp. LEGE 06141]|uniref:glycosyltransferase n=1 Tax=Oculatella sp. LEGE 06141 TaxID=1828648 RepID=UPI00187DE798|nr:glycosyltransferase [Oculatella sp. LEGE 06141]MBE9178833.1 glycosyltransferase [Oculatella sp. LEGE 06141]